MVRSFAVNIFLKSPSKDSVTLGKYFRFSPNWTKCYSEETFNSGP